MGEPASHCKTPRFNGCEVAVRGRREGRGKEERRLVSPRSTGEGEEGNTFPTLE